MGTKEGISGGYIESWHHLTKDWEVPDTEERAALIIGRRHGNIGDAIFDELSDLGFARVHSLDINSSAFPFDVNNESDLSTVTWAMYDTLILANGETNLDWIENQPLEKIQSVIDNKLTGTIKAVSAFAAANVSVMDQIKNIVVIGSMAHKSVLNASAPYCAACAGVNHFVRCAAWELAPKGFRVFIVNPSNVEGTPMTEETIQGISRYRGIPYTQAMEYWAAVRAIPEWLTKEDIGKLVGRLVTDEEMRWLAGVPLDMGGGIR